MSVLLGGTGAFVGEYALAWCIEGLGEHWITELWPLIPRIWGDAQVCAFFLPAPGHPKNCEPSVFFFEFPVGLGRVFLGSWMQLACLLPLESVCVLLLFSTVFSGHSLMDCNPSASVLRLQCTEESPQDIAEFAPGSVGQHGAQEILRFQHTPGDAKATGAWTTL